MQHEGLTTTSVDERDTGQLRHPALTVGGRAAVPRTAVPLAVIRPATVTTPPIVEPLAPTVWRLEPRRRRRIGLMAVGLAAVGLAVSAISASLVVRERPDLVEAILLLAPALLLFVSALSLARATRRIRLVVTDDGLTSVGVMSTLITPWADVERLGMVGRGIYRGVGFHLARPGTIRGPGLVRKLGLGAAPWFVPLGPYTSRFDGSDLQTELRMRCPRLFGDHPSRAPRPHL